jgi:hypothetical protein
VRRHSGVVFEPGALPDARAPLKTHVCPCSILFYPEKEVYLAVVRPFIGAISDI